MRTEHSWQRFSPRAKGLLATAGIVALFVLITPARAGAEITPLGTIGGVGSGAGQLMNPGGMAIQAGTGDLYVADKYNNRISIFDPGGNFIKTFGWGVQDGSAAPQVCSSGCQIGLAGGGAGQLDHPTAVAFDSSGNLFTASRYSNRIDEFTPDGQFIRAFGWDVIAGTSPNTGLQTCTAAPPGCQAATPGGEAGRFNNPRGVVVDSAGNVWIADEVNNRVDEFTTQGAFVKAFGWDVVAGTAPDTGLQTCTAAPPGCQVGTSGGKAGELFSPRGVTVDSGGTLYIGDAANRRISEFSSGGEFIRAFGWDVVPPTAPGTALQVCTTTTTCQSGTGGSGAGQFASPSPYGIALDGNGNLYAADPNNNRVDEFTTQGDFIKTFGWGVTDGSAAFQICTAGCHQGLPGAGAGEFYTPEGVTVDCRGSLYVSEISNDRIQRLGEPGAALGPCPAAPQPQPQPQPVAQDFSFGKVKKNKKKGTATVTIAVPAAGQIEAGDANDSQIGRAEASRSKLKVRRVLRTAAGPGKVKVPIRPTRRGFKKLKHSGRLKTKLKFVYTATGAPSTTKTLKLTLILVRP
jgi:DNA-binding beta-propeller fold protein YncE